MKKTATILSATFMSLTVFAGVSQAATLPKYTGYGWAVKHNSKGSWNLKHNFTYTIKFVNTDSKNKSLPYMKATVNYLNAMPEMKSAKIKFNLTTQIEGLTNFKNKNWCGGKFGTLYFITKYRPTGVKNQSVAHSCYNTSTNAAWGGYAIMNSEYWSQSKTTRWKQSMNNIHAHELGHLLGLGHPNPKYYKSSEPTPIMHTTAGGYMNSNAGKYPAPDRRGIVYLIKAG